MRLLLLLPLVLWPGEYRVGDQYHPSAVYRNGEMVAEFHHGGAIAAAQEYVAWKNSTPLGVERLDPRIAILNLFARDNGGNVPSELLTLLSQLQPIAVEKSKRQPTYMVKLTQDEVKWLDLLIADEIKWRSIQFHGPGRNQTLAKDNDDWCAKLRPLLDKLKAAKPE